MVMTEYDVQRFCWSHSLQYNNTCGAVYSMLFSYLSSTLRKPRWPMNVSEGSHLPLISSHFRKAEFVMTYCFNQRELPESIRLS